MALKEYDPGDVVFIFGPVIITDGWAEDSMIKVSRDEDTYTKKVGAAGEVTRVRNRNRSGSFELTLMQSSAQNALLSAVAATDELSGDGVHPIMLKDLGGNTIATAANAWIRKMPETEFTKEVGARTWMFDCDIVTQLEGGN